MFYCICKLISFTFFSFVLILKGIQAFSLQEKVPSAEKSNKRGRDWLTTLQFVATRPFAKGDFGDKSGCRLLRPQTPFCLLETDNYAAFCLERKFCSSYREPAYSHNNFSTEISQRYF